MEFLQRLPFPRRLPSRLWLFSLPSALISFERRQRLPRLPIGRWRFLGVPLIGAGLGLWAYARRCPQTAPFRECTRRTGGPGVTAGLVVLAGAALLLRSLVLALYTLALALAASSRAITIEEPQSDFLLGDNRSQDNGPPYPS